MAIHRPEVSVWPGQSGVGFKPRPWNVQRRYVAPEGQWFYQDLADVAVLWEGGGLPYTLKQGIQAQEIDNVVPQWVATPKGLGLLVGETADNDGRIFWDGVGDLDANEGQTIAAYVAEIDVSQISGEDFATTLCGYGNISSPSDGTDAGDNFAMSVGDGDTATEGTVFVYTSGGNTRSEATGTVVSDGNPHFIVATWDQPAGVIEVWVDGELQYTVTGYTDTSSEDNAPLSFGESGNRTVMGLQRQLWVGAWNSVWTPAQIRHLARDPFAPFRPARRTVVFVAGGAQTISVGQAIETETAFGVGSAKSQSVGQATESEVAQALTAEKAYSLGLSTESEAATAVAIAKSLAVGQATESETGRVVDAAKSLQVGQAIESESAFGVTVAKLFGVGQATESETATTVSSGTGTPVGQAVESETAQAVGSAKSYTVGLATETETGLSVQPLRTYGIGQSTEVEQALAVTLARAVELGLAVESEQGLTVVPLKEVSVGRATETETALAVVVVGAALDLRGPFLMHGEGPKRLMSDEGPDRRMFGEGPERDMSGEE